MRPFANMPDDIQFDVGGEPGSQVVVPVFTPGAEYKIWEPAGGKRKERQAREDTEALEAAGRWDMAWNAATCMHGHACCGSVSSLVCPTFHLHRAATTMDNGTIWWHVTTQEAWHAWLHYAIAGFLVKTVADDGRYTLSRPTLRDIMYPGENWRCVLTGMAEEGCFDFSDFAETVEYKVWDYQRCERRLCDAMNGLLCTQPYISLPWDEYIVRKADLLKAVDVLMAGRATGAWLGLCECKLSGLCVH